MDRTRQGGGSAPGAGGAPGEAGAPGAGGPDTAGAVGDDALVVALEHAVMLLREAGHVGLPTGPTGPAAGPADRVRSTGQILDLLRRLEGAADAVRAQVRVALAHGVEEDLRATDMVRDEQNHPRRFEEQVRDLAGAEISLRERVSPARALRGLEHSRILVQDMPGVHEALADGDLAPAHADRVASAVGIVAPERRGEIDEGLVRRLPSMQGKGMAAWGRAVDVLAHRVDPHGEAARHDKATEERCVALHPREHGMATLALTLPRIDAALVYKQLGVEAESLRANGDRRSHGQRMADVAVRRLRGGPAGADGDTGTAMPIKVEVGVLIPVDTLLDGPGSEPAIIEDVGPVPGERVRQWISDLVDPPEAGHSDPLGPDGDALRVTFRRVFTHPESQELLAVESAGRVFPRGLARFIHWRDQQCGGPYCDASRRQTDHVRAWVDGGVTRLDNGADTCVWHNRKERVFARVERSSAPTGSTSTRWQTRYGTEVDVPAAGGPTATGDAGDQGGPGT